MTSTGLLGEDFVLVDALPRKGGSAAGNSGELIPKNAMIFFVYPKKIS